MAFEIIKLTYLLTGSFIMYDIFLLRSMLADQLMWHVGSE